jgi:hypothetical protein
MNTPSNIKGFFSYGRQNDKHGSGHLSSLRKCLEIELWEQTGGNIEIFQDQEDIEWGEIWKKKIITSLNESKFLIAIVTPSYLKSEACRFELQQFIEIEKKMGDERILPLIYIDTPELKTINDSVFLELNNRQWVDWKDLRFSSLTSVSSKRKIASLAKRIRQIIFNKPSTNKNETRLNLNIPNSVTRIIPENKNTASKTVKEKFLPVSPPPDNFPDDWDKQWQPSFDKPTISSQKEPKIVKNEKTPLPLYAQLAKENKDTDHPPQKIIITLHSNGDIDRDKRRIKTLYGTLISYHGRDEFSFKITGTKDGKENLIEFPNDTTRICPELLARLKKLMGEESWRVEEITYQ